MSKTFKQLGITKLTDIILNKQINIPVKTKFGSIKQKKTYLVEKAVMEMYGKNGWEDTISVKYNEDNNEKNI